MADLGAEELRTTDEFGQFEPSCRAGSTAWLRTGLYWSAYAGVGRL
jgi:hypothetical protein